MDDYIPKPAEKKQLVSMIRKWCDEDCSTDSQNSPTQFRIQGAS
ncbi:hypothetical protein JCM19235_5637 [Vibrio maritimus]|uniref:Uncharacterized protein n=2 Tax=Vibrio maritimus TaxID=990268 RepID=A0A090RRB5_9VIBR|nr:hypothetical protein JCM19235_5637 [Vibrio maritimus]